MRGLVAPPLPFAEAERKADPNRLEHNTVPGKLPTAQIVLFAKPRAGAGPAEERAVRAWASPAGSGRRRPGRASFPVWGRLPLGPPISVRGGLTNRGPAEPTAPPPAGGATLNSRRRHFSGE